MSHKISKFIFNILSGIDVSFILIVSGLLLFNDAFRTFLHQTPSLMLLIGFFLILGLGLSFGQNTIYPDQKAATPPSFVIQKEMGSSYTINPKTPLGIVLYVILCFIIVGTVLSEILI